jgi:chromate transporter
MSGAGSHGDEGGRARLPEVAWLFLRLGATAFGGPLAHIAMMEREVVRRGWVTREDFLDLVGVTHLLPGPNSTEMAMHLGHARAGAPGLVVGGVCFILPAAAITAGLAWAYVHYGRLPETAAILYGTKPVIVAVVAQALVHLGRTAVKRRSLAVIGLAAVIAAVLGVHELIVLAATGLAAAAIGGAPTDPKGAPADPKGAPTAPNRAPDARSPDEKAPSPGEEARSSAFGAGLSAQAALGAGAGAAGAGVAGVAAAPFGLWPLFLTFAKIGSILFGSGYVLLAFLRADLVERQRWLTEAQLLDAVTVGQVTPGPVLSTATFIGYVLGGGAGAAVATLGIFLPAFLVVAASGPVVRRLRASPRARALLDGVNVASLALMAVVTARLGRAAIVDPLTACIAVASLAVLLRFKPNATWLVLAGAAVGLAARGG